jgi:hypothetical protein
MAESPERRRVLKFNFLTACACLGALVIFVFKIS